MTSQTGGSSRPIDTTAAASSKNPPVALTIAGSDSGGGAGIQADLTTFSALGVHGSSVVTALTAQNTATVAAVHVPPVDFLDDQLDAVLSDLPVAAVKTGMLATEAVVRAVAARAAAGQLPNLVVDPVLVSSTGARLLDAGAESAYVDTLFPHALVVTPNSREAAVLAGHPVTTVDEAVAAARTIAATGAPWVVVKGGHLDHGTGEAVDVVYESATGDVRELRSPWIDTPNDHGTGCTFGAAATALLARGDAVPEALAGAKRFVHAGLEASAGWRLGAGHGPVSHLCR
ncbi:MAG: bifunctional hydroxymethylpyrimidine kinase/phosphomethylpyrimidine kinase [Acidimicrobiales bacterium]